MKSFLRIVFVLAVCFSTVAFAANTKKTKKETTPGVQLPSSKPSVDKKDLDDFKADDNFKPFVGAAEEYERGAKEFASQKARAVANKSVAKSLDRYEKRLKEKKDRCYKEAEKALKYIREETEKLKDKKFISAKSLEKEQKLFETRENAIYYYIMTAEEHLKEGAKKKN